MNANQRRILYTLLVLTVFGAGFTAADAFGYVHMPMVHFLNKEAMPNELSACDQSATTSDCAALLKQTQSASKPAAQQAVGAPTPTYGPLAETYHVAAGISFKYPAELRVDSGGDTILNDARDPKDFALKICEAGSSCAARYASLNPQSLEDFNRTYISSYGESSTYGAMIYQETPSGERTFTNSVGTKILELKLTPKVLDSKGNDITAQECEECGGAAIHYIVFEDSKRYVDFWSIADSASLTPKILDTVTY
jgi:hypothetical protein